MTTVDGAAPAAPSSPAPWTALSFDDFLTFPAPSPAPTPAPAATPTPAPSAPPAAAGAAASAPAPAPQSPRRSGAVVPSTPATVQVAGTPPGATGPPPPPGSAPEVLFRYYLAAELRRIGSSADDHIIEKYVAQHYSSISKKAAPPVASSSTAPAAHAPAAQPALTYEPYRRAPSPPAPAFPHAQAFRDATPPSPEAFLDPHTLVLPAPSLALPQQSSTVGVHEPFTVARAPVVPSSKASGSYSKSRRAADAMSEDSSDGGQSEDEDEDDKSSFANLGAHTGGRGTLSAAAMLRPSPEEYRKLSSKEKRQLRNKISARNFRTRRKEHITALESELSDRDSIIAGLRAQLSQLSIANASLTEEVRTLKRTQLSATDVSRILEALQKSTGVALPVGAAPASDDQAMLASSSNPASRPSTPTSPRPSLRRNESSLLNTRKDVGPATASKSFWGGRSTAQGSALVAAS